MLHVQAKVNLVETFHRKSIISFLGIESRENVPLCFAKLPELYPPLPAKALHVYFRAPPSSMGNLLSTMVFSVPSHSHQVLQLERPHSGPENVSALPRTWAL